MISYPLKPWTRAAFELIAHAEQHLRDGADFDRRVAIIGFDNAIEVAITTYLGLHPIQREGRQYKREDVTKWLENYHSKLEFLAQEAQASEFSPKVPSDEIVYYHKLRSDQYHTGGSGVPEADCLAALRTAALDTFGFLYGVVDVEELLEDWLEKTALSSEQTMPRDETADWLLDDASEPVIIAGQPYRVSEALRTIDPNAYRAAVAAIAESRNVFEQLCDKYPDAIRPKIKFVGFVHYEEDVFLKTVDSDGEVLLMDTEFIMAGGQIGSPYFTSARSPNENADLLVNDFRPYSIINCFEFLTEEAAIEIARAHQADQTDARPGSVHNSSETMS